MKQGRILVLLALSLAAAACAGSVRPPASPSTPRTDALLVLPGLGYNRGAEKTLRSLAPAARAEGIDLYVADYLTRSGLDDSRAKLQRFLRENRLHQYQRLHVFAFIAGAWTVNPMAGQGALPNLATVIYDRSPLQERAPRIAVEKLRTLAWLRYGSTVGDLARTPFPALAAEKVNVGLLVETTPTSLLRKYEKIARSHGPIQFECEAFAQRFDDCMFVAMNHGELYRRFPEVWPELLSFIRTGQFTRSANRQPPAGDPFK